MSADRSRRTVALVVTLALIVAIGAALVRGSFRDEPYEPGSPRPGGSKAVVSVLEDLGTGVQTERRTAGAAADLRAGATVLVTDPSALGREQLEALRTALDEGEGHLVLLLPDFGSLAVLAPGTRPTGTLAEPTDLRADERCGDASFSARTVRAGPAQLDEDGRVLSPARLYTGPDGSRSCFRADRGAVVVRSDRVTVLGSARFLTNGGVGGADDAAVALNALHDEEVTWYLPSATDPMATTVPGPLERLPAWSGPVALWLILTALLALWALSFRLGPVVVEPLPVRVRAQELTIGRAHLWRRARARDRAARALRSATAVRLADRLGLRRQEGLDALIAALAERTGADPSSLRRLLGPEPVTHDPDLVRLARDLDRLIQETER